MSQEALNNAVRKVVSNSTSDDNRCIPWTNCIYKIWYNIRRLFQDPYKQPQPDLNLLEQVSFLLNAEDLNEDTINRCEHLICLHRITENTSARKRLEKWTNRVIEIYLIIVGLIVVACACNFQFTFNGVKYTFDLPNEVLITILSTTTINIIGLAVILMKGHFPHDEKKKEEKKEQ